MQKTSEASVEQDEDEEKERGKHAENDFGPNEAIASGPKKLKKCSESYDVAKPQEILSEMPHEETAPQFDYSNQSGLLVPIAKVAEDDGKEETTDGQKKDTKDMEI